MRQLYRRSLLFLVIISFFTALGHAQVWKLRRYELIGGLGTSQYFGDIGGYSNGENLLGLKDVSFRNTRPMFDVGFRYKILETSWIKMNLISGWLHGNDKGGVNDARDIIFNSYLFEPTIQFEQVLINSNANQSYLMMKGKGISSFTNSLGVYVFAGVGTIIASPKAKEDKYNRMNTITRVAMSFPVGVGCKYALDPNWSVGFELGPHFTTSDYIDGFSSQFSKHNDVCLFMNVHAIWKLKTSRKNLPIFGL